MIASTPTQEYSLLKGLVTNMVTIAKEKVDAGIPGPALQVCNFYLPSEQPTDVTAHVAALYGAKKTYAIAMGSNPNDPEVFNVMAVGLINSGHIVRCQDAKDSVRVGTNVGPVKIQVTLDEHDSKRQAVFSQYHLTVQIAPGATAETAVITFQAAGISDIEPITGVSIADFLTDADAVVVGLSKFDQALTPILKRRIAALAGFEFVESASVAQDQLDYGIAEMSATA